jgi:hypothetical protein
MIHPFAIVINTSRDVIKRTDGEIERDLALEKTINQKQRCYFLPKQKRNIILEVFLMLSFWVQQNHQNGNLIKIKYIFPLSLSSFPYLYI